MLVQEVDDDTSKSQKSQVDQLEGYKTITNGMFRPQMPEPEHGDTILDDRADVTLLIEKTIEQTPMSDENHLTGNGLENTQDRFLEGLKLPDIQKSTPVKNQGVDIKKAKPQKKKKKGGKNIVSPSGASQSNASTINKKLVSLDNSHEDSMENCEDVENVKLILKKSNKRILAGIEGQNSKSQKLIAPQTPSPMSKSLNMSMEAKPNQKSMAMSNFNVEEKVDKSQEDLRHIFIDNYGVQMEIPAYYYYDAKFVPHFKDQLVTMAFHIIPKKQKYHSNVQTTYIDGRVENNSWKELYDLTGENIILNLYALNGRRGLEKKREVYLEDVNNALMQFSKSGDHLGIYIQGDNILSIFDSKDIDKCFDNIEKQDTIFQVQLENKNFGKATRLVFDQHDQYVAIVSSHSIIIYSLKEEELGKQVREYKIDDEKYGEILDLVMDSYENGQPIQGKNFACQIACQCVDITSVQIFDISAENDIRNISYAQKLGKKVVKISDDFNRVIFSNGREHYTLNGRNQENFPHIKDKYLRDVVSQEDNFFLVTSKDYDRDIDVLSSNDLDFNISVKRSIEPGILSVYDTNIDTKLGHLKILSRIGDILYIDTMDIAKGREEDPLEGVIETVVEQHYRS